MAKKKDAWFGDGRGGLAAAAIFGLITVSASMGAYYTSSLAPTVPYPTYVSTAPDEARANSIARGVIQRPCVAMVGHDEIDLCAQWRAAVAAEHAAFWGFAQMALSLAGLIGLLITLGFNQKALVLAARSQAETRRIGQAQVRSYLDLSKVRLNISADGIPSVSLSLRNVGQSPALQIEVTTSVQAIGLAVPGKETLSCIAPRKIPNIMSGDNVKFSRQPCEYGISKKVSDLVDQNDMGIGFLVFIVVVWRDVFNNAQRLKQSYTLPTHVTRDVDMKVVRTDQYLAQLHGEVVRRKHLGTWTLGGKTETPENAK